MLSECGKKERRGKPRWLSRRLPSGPAYEQTRNLLRAGRLHTVCQEARCPNQFECFAARTAAFLILGPVCTRGCGFCSVESGVPRRPDPDEPERVAEAADRLQLRYVVVTSVTRDDLPDGGAEPFRRTIEAIRRRTGDAQVEVLIPDFQGDGRSLDVVLGAGPAVLNHNVETVPRLYPEVRPAAVYGRSVELLRRAAAFRQGLPVKSGLMLGLGETDAEIAAVLEDLRSAGCSMLTLGQYLQPSRASLPVRRFVAPEEFESWRERAIALGFRFVASGPFVRSSYHARELYGTTVTP